MLERALVPRWISRQLAQLREAAFLELVLVVVATPASGRARRPLRELLFSLYESADYLMFKTSPDALELVDATSELETECPLLNVQLDSSAEPFSKADLETVRSHEPDVIVWFAGGQPGPDIIDCAGQGVWTVHHGDPTRYRGGPPFFWELYDRQTVTTTVVEEFSDRGDLRPRSIYSTRSAVHPQSLYQTRNAPYWKAAQFILRCLERLEDEGERALEPEVAPESPETRGTVEARGVPTNAQMAWFALRLLGRAGRSRLRRLFYREHWYLGYRMKREVELTDDAQACAVDMRGFAIVSTRARASADPFVMSRDGGHYVFFEELPSGSDRGAISQFEVLPTGSVTERKTVLSRGYHLSYPFVFAMGDETYMLPETASNGAIELYRAEEFPTTWTFERTLIANVKAVDPTLLERDGRLWLFANVKEYGAPYSDELFIYYADSLDGPWTPHPCNPVVSDVRRARPAGRIFERGGVLIRPGQDSAGRYGRAVSLNRIDLLTEDDYRETEIGRIEETWRARNLGTHTYNFDERYEVIDGREWVLRFRR